MEAICATVPVSARTFFNYFESKEDAILGVRDLRIDDELIAEHSAETAGQTLVSRVVGLLVTVVGSSIADPELHEARMQIIAQNPGLLGRQFAQMSHVGEQLVAATSTLLAHDPALAGATADERNVLAELIFPLCGGAVRVAVKEWIAAGGEEPTHELRRRAVELAGKAISALS